MDGFRRSSGQERAGGRERSSGGRKKETAEARRLRRLRAEARVFDRLLKAGQAVMVHHNAPSNLYQFLREFHQRYQPSPAPPPPPPVRRQLQLRSLLAQAPRPQDGPVDLVGGGGDGPGGAPLGCSLGGGGGGCGGCGVGVGGSFPVVAVGLAVGAAAASVDVARSSSVDVARSSSVVVARSSPSAPDLQQAVTVAALQQAILLEFQDRDLSTLSVVALRYSIEARLGLGRDGLKSRRHEISDFARDTAEQLQLSSLSPSMSSSVGGAFASSTQQPPVQLQQQLLPIAPIIVSCSDSENDLDLDYLAARSVQPQQEPLTLPLTLDDHAHGVVCIESEELEILITGKCAAAGAVGLAWTSCRWHRASGTACADPIARGGGGRGGSE